MKKWPVLSTQQKQELLQLREQGWRPAALARKFNFPVRCVYHWTQDAQMPRGFKRAAVKVSDDLHPLLKHLFTEIMLGPPIFLVALKSNYSPQTIARWFRGQKSPELAQIQTVLDVLDCDIVWTIKRRRGAAGKS